MVRKIPVGSVCPSKAARLESARAYLMCTMPMVLFSRCISHMHFWSLSLKHFPTWEVTFLPICRTLVADSTVFIQSLTASPQSSAALGMPSRLARSKLASVMMHGGKLSSQLFVQGGSVTAVKPFSPERSQLLLRTTLAQHAFDDFPWSNSKAELQVA